MRTSETQQTRPFRIPETVYGLIQRMFHWGGAAFLIGVGYVAWGIYSGRLDDAMKLAAADRYAVAQHVLFACKLISYGGIACLIGAAAKFYYEETLGYILLMIGAALYWGVAVAAGPTFQQMNEAALELAVYALRQVQTVGMVSLALAVPFILGDFWARLSGARRFRVVTSSRGPDQRDEMQKTHLYLFCWQMPYCRDNLRKVCDAFEQKKPCWRIKTGCYCDEGLIMKSLRRGNPAAQGSEQQFTRPPDGPSKHLTPAQKRERCRQCFLYGEHQRQKFKILSPLAFPLVIGLMWVYLKPLKDLLGAALAFTDKFAGSVSFGPKPDQVAESLWLDKAATSNVVEWMFIICIGLILITYTLKAIEYLVFELQV